MTPVFNHPTNSLNTLNGDFSVSMDGFDGLIGDSFELPRSISWDTKPKPPAKPTKSSTVARKRKPKIKAGLNKAKQKQIIPEKEDFIEGEPTDVDVTGGRGGGSNSHIGNKPYWSDILKFRTKYRSLRNDAQKRQLAHCVARAVAARGGRFLLKDKETEKWFKMREENYIDKIQQAFRDKYIPEWARDWMKVDFPDEYSLFLQEQHSRKKNATKPKSGLLKAKETTKSQVSSASVVRDHPPKQAAAPVEMKNHDFGSTSNFFGGDSDVVFSFVGRLSSLDLDPQIDAENGERQSSGTTQNSGFHKGKETTNSPYSFASIGRDHLSKQAASVEMKNHDFTSIPNIPLGNSDFSFDLILGSLSSLNVDPKREADHDERQPSRTKDWIMEAYNCDLTPPRKAEV